MIAQTGAGEPTNEHRGGTSLAGHHQRICPICVVASTVSKTDQETLTSSKSESDMILELIPD